MINILKIETAAGPEQRIAAIIEEAGAWRVLRAAVRAAVRGGARPVADARDLPPHLQRDIGLPPEIEVPRAWEVWR
jgi:hypothetical protein